MKYRIFPAVILFLTSLHAGTFYPPKAGEATVVNQYLVKLLPGAPASLIQTLFPGSVVEPLHALNIHKVTLPSGSSLSTAMSLSAHPLVAWVEPNRKRKVVLVSPNDPGLALQYALTAVQAQQAWTIMPNAYLTAATSNTSRIKVGVIDTGVDCTHPDFMNAGAVSTDSALGGQLLFSLSQAAINTTVPQAKCAWQDDYGHGTHVAGIVAAATQNNTGIASLGYPLQVVVYKGLDSSGNGDDATLGNIIMVAADAGVHILSASWGDASYSQTLQDATNYAWQRNTLLIAAAGNDSANEVFFPAGAIHAVGVAATDSTNTVASFSNYGNLVSIAAPGVNVYSTLPTYPTPIGNVNYGGLSGTSMATPHVSALAGLLAMATPNASMAAVLQRIEQSAVSNTANGGWEPTKGYGIINAYDALSGSLRTATTGALTGQVTDGSGNPVGSASLTVNGQLVTADPNGLYRFAAFPAGTYAVTVSASGFPAQQLSATIAAGADTVLPVLMGLNYGSFTGTVRDAGVAVAGAIVQATIPGANGPLIQATAVTDLNGAYTLWVAPGTYSVTASALSFNSATVSNQTVSAGGSTSVSLTMARLGRINGTVRNGQGQPFSGVQLLITGGGMSFGAVSDANGNYKTIGLPSGAYTIDASYPAYADVIVPNTAVALDGTTTVNIQFVTPTAFPIAIFGTGVDSSGTLVADGTVDAHYSLISSADPAYPGPSAYVVTSTVFPIPPWMPDGPYSKWIAPRTDAGAGIGNVAGNYTYRTTFDLTGFTPSTAVLTGQFAADNIGVIKLNGNVVGPSTSTYSSWTPFTINSGFVSGVNTLDFVVTNTCCSSNNPTGLRVDLSGTASLSGNSPITVTVMPSTATLTAGQNQPFTVQVTGTANQSVSWTISPLGTGSMNGNTYVAPSSVASQVIVTLKATSLADNTTYGTAKVTVNPPSTALPITIFGTGVASLSTLAVDSTVDAHYSLVSSADSAYPGPSAYVVISNLFPIPPWMPDGPNSKWIAPRADAGAGIGNVAGNYTYRTTFDLTGFTPGTAVLTGQFAADNAAVIKLNGNPVGPASPGFGAWTPFTINSGFVSGVNTLDFVVTNACCSSNNPTGLRVDISGTASPSGPPPPITVTVMPSTATLTAGQSQPFTVQVTGTTNQGVTWTISPLGTGSMNGNTYVAPATVASQVIVTLKATSMADNTTYGTAMVTVNPPSTTFPISIFGTGVASSSTLAADGAVDAHYSLVSSADAAYPGPKAYVVTSTVFPIPPWMPDGPNSKWIAPRADAGAGIGNVAGIYTYRTTFDLTGFTPSTAVLTGQFAADNSAIIKLNGNPVGPTSLGFGAWTPFTINSGFVSGVNTLDFVVTNACCSSDNPTGLRVDIGGTASPSGPPPPITVTVMPPTTTLTAGQSQPFTVQVTGTTNQGVTWTISPPGTGSMNGNTYVAPATVASQVIVTLKATSMADNTTYGTATVTVNPPSTTFPITILGTGVVSSGTLAADGAVDAHYSLVSSADPAYPGPKAYVVTSTVFPIPPWMPDGPNSKWIAPRADAGAGIGNVAGNYTYRTTFDLTGFTPSTAVLTGQFAADNSAIIKLNGNPVGPTSLGFDAWTPFTINSGFVSGVNTLDFVVTNACCSSNNPTGLRVDISGTVSH